MELSEKIQKLRKEHHLTQEQFAEQLFVSRTAVSKWETGRGIPSIESLQAIAKLFHITLDDLLRADELVFVAENENKENIKRFSYLVDGILSIIAIFGLFLPLYKANINDVFYSVPLYQIHGLLTLLYWVFPFGMIATGIIQILISDKERGRLYKVTLCVGFLTNISEIFLLILGGHPYPAMLFFVLLILRGFIIIRK